MPNPWLILLVVTLGRMTMGFQFQSLASVGPLLVEQTTISFAALGALIGIYLLPGAFVAIPGGWLGARFGDKRTTLVGLAMMTGGGVLLASSDIYELMFAGRLISGTGAVLLNVLGTKMVTDWFAGKRIVTAMGILISSWPLGIGLALLALPSLAETVGLFWALTAPTLLCAVAMLLLGLIYTTPPNIETQENHTPALTRTELRGALLSGGVWCFYNIAFILPLSFGPEFLSARGMELAAAGVVVSLMSWLIIPALPLGGWFAEHIGRPVLTMSISFAAIAALLCLIPTTSSYVTLFVVLGLIFGPAGGLIMALPASVLRPQNRALGMGIYFTVYYVGMGVAPWIAGYLRDASGDPSTPIWFAAGMIMVAFFALIAFSVTNKPVDTE